MREIIKEYELDDNISIYKLEKCNFKRVEPTAHDKLLEYYYVQKIIEDIYVFIQVGISSDNKFIFNDAKDIDVFDDDLDARYNAFYNEEKDFNFLNDVIRRYNALMDELVEKGILKPKDLKKENKPKTLINKRIEE